MIDPLERKARTEERLQALGISINPHLPAIESIDQARFRSPQEVARRAVLLLAVAALAFGKEGDPLVEWLHREGLMQHASKQEREFFEDPERFEELGQQLSWRVEALMVLAWALCLLDDLGLPEEQCSAADLFPHLPAFGESTADFIASAKLRDGEELLDFSDLIYRAHWAARDARIGNGANPGPIDISICMEWHHAINWITCADDEDDWDRVPTST